MKNKLPKNHRSKEIPDKNSLKKNNLQMNNNQKYLDEIKQRVAQLTYEESIEVLESILNSLQNDDISLDQIQNKYLEGNIYLKHCEKLLHKVEQEITELSLED